MNTYIYDGSFDGLLTAIYQSYYQPEKPDNIVTEQHFTGGMFVNRIEIRTDSEKATKVSEAVVNKISRETLQHAYRAYLSELPEIENAIYRYLRLGFKIGSNINSLLFEQAVMSVLQTSQKVSRERHRMLGLVRFRCTDNNIYYAAMEPDFNILGLIAPHFAKRLSDQNWVIHDLKRGIAVLYNGSRWVLVELATDKQFSFTEQEDFYQQLWKDYFNSATVAGRKNPKLQRQFMPARYWKHLIEM